MQTRYPRLTLLWLGLFVLPIASPSAWAQPAEPPLVDRAVGDLDPLATSMRRVDPAFGASPTSDRLFELQAANPQAGTPGQFLLQAPDFRATFTQPDYITLTPQGRDLNTAQLVDGAFIELIPPGTIFHLGEAPGTETHVGPTGPDRRRFQGGPMEGRMQLRFDARPVDPRLGFEPDVDRIAGPGFDGPDTLTLVPDAPAPTGVTLQPWVTAEDLREADRFDVPIPDHVVLTGDPEAWSPDPPPVVPTDPDEAPPPPN